MALSSRGSTLLGCWLLWLSSSHSMPVGASHTKPSRQDLVLCRCDQVWTVFVQPSLPLPCFYKGVTQLSSVSTDAV